MKKPYPTLYMKIKYECVRDLNVKYETMSLLEENMDEFLYHQGIGKRFPVTQNPEAIED